MATYLPDPRVVGLQRLEDAATAPVQARFVDGFPESVRTQVQVVGAGPVERALDYFDSYADLYGVESPRHALEPVRSSDPDADTGLEFVSLQQTLDGIPVWNSSVNVLLHGDEVLGTLGNLLTDTPPVDAQPTIGVTAAEERALAEVGGGQIVGQSHLVVYDPALLPHGPAGPPASQPTLAWGVQVLHGSETELLIDADDGELLLELGHDHEAFDLDVEDAKYQPDDGPYGCYYTYSTTEVADEDGVYAAHQNNPDAHRAYSRALSTYNYFAGFDRDGYDDNGDEIEVYIDAKLTNTVAKFKSGAMCEALMFEWGRVTTDIFTHEFTHAIDDDEQQIVYLNESGAVEESFADVFGSLHDGNWTIGETAASPTGFRNLQDPTRHRSRELPKDSGMRYTHPDHYDDYVVLPADLDNGGVHINSGIPNKAAYLLTDGGTHDQVPVQGLGSAKVGRLMYAALLTAGSTPSFQRVRDAVETHAHAYSLLGQFGFSPATLVDDVCSVRNAYGAVGVGAPDIGCDGLLDDADLDDDGDGVADDQDNCFRVSNPLQGNVDGDVAGDACDGDIDNDGVPNADDNCPRAVNADQKDSNGDGIGNACSDKDNDGVLDVDDNCPANANHDQADTDADGQGDACDADLDGDGVENATDNCPSAKNADQLDADQGGLGDACDQHVHNPVNDCIELDRCPDGRSMTFGPNSLDRIMVDLCAGGCPENWLDPGSTVSISVAVPTELAPHLRITAADVGGTLVAKASFPTAGLQTMSTQTMTSLVFPAGGLGRYVLHVIADPDTPSTTGTVSAQARRVVVAPPAQEEVIRLAGRDRYTTAVTASQSAFVSGTKVAYVATGLAYADALAGGAAAAHRQGPVLLTDPARLPMVTATELQRLQPEQVVVVGGPSAVSDAVLGQIRELGLAVTRTAGRDRYATAAEVSRAAFPPSVPVAYVATGTGFADALAGGAAAAHAGGPVLLTDPKALPTATADELRRLQPARVVVVGGTSAVADEVVASIRRLGLAADRVAGRDRFATAAAVSADAFPDGADWVHVATGSNYPDALAGTPAAHLRGGPLLLTLRESVPESIAAEIRRLGATRAALLGGTSAVADAAARALADILPEGT